MSRLVNDASGRANSRPGFKVQGSRFKVQGSRFKVQGSRFKVQGSGFKVHDSGFKVRHGGRRRSRTVGVVGPLIDTGYVVVRVVHPATVA
jgi:hypothetical protein